MEEARCALYYKVRPPPVRVPRPCPVPHGALPQPGWRAAVKEQTQSPAVAWTARGNKGRKGILPPVLASTQRFHREAGNTTWGLCASEHSRARPVAKQRNAQAVFPWEGNAAEEPEGREPRVSKEEG
ncbi:hypothetical protein NDU88_006644 [Pleurodeles waltl]|uniref:Uncharacterized protein n=1 Tax=Pleurodeles waltl TaxID=8319 RepID=A0AAV7X188_PLEWA|nr:hypothetical protein NDU88_006644 [Pleurodeles waltl]